MTKAPYAFDPRAILGVETFAVRLSTIHGSKIHHHLTQQEVNRLITSWNDLLSEVVDRVVFQVWEEV